MASALSRTCLHQRPPYAHSGAATGKMLHLFRLKELPHRRTLQLTTCFTGVHADSAPSVDQALEIRGVYRPRGSLYVTREEHGAHRASYLLTLGKLASTAVLVWHACLDASKHMLRSHDESPSTFLTSALNSIRRCHEAMSASPHTLNRSDLHARYSAFQGHVKRTLTKQYVSELFHNLETGQAPDFLSRVADNVDWTIKGTHPLAGHYTSRKAFQVNLPGDQAHQICMACTSAPVLICRLAFTADAVSVP